eukprot:GHVS01036500.1.p1 GENE.GHVS01036500.1~~GHVS01036500.1.p1  ORF type:complete len:288 (+),score=24.62 GHVS01036500.1:42-905(+)
MGLKCFVCGTFAALVICLITACLADTSLRSPVRQLGNIDEMLHFLSVNDVGKSDWFSIKSKVTVTVEKNSEEDELIASVNKNKIFWNTQKGKTVVVNGEGLNASSISEEETDEAIGKRLARNIEYLVEKGHHNFRIDFEVEVDVLLSCLKAMNVLSTKPNINITSAMFIKLVEIGWLKDEGFVDKYVVVMKKQNDFTGSTYLVFNDKETPDHNCFDFKGIFEEYYVDVYFLKMGQKFIYYEENGKRRKKRTVPEWDWIRAKPKGVVPEEAGWAQVSKDGSQKPKDGK